jgi:hypothetical protein
MFASDEHSEDGSPVHCGDCGDEIVEESYEHKNAREQAAELQESAIMIDGTPAFFSLAIKLKDTPRMWGASARHVLAQVLRDLANKAETDGINLETGNLWVDGQIVGQSALIEF